ncbi:hypothetical protein B0H66DRAFT_96720 [Apodospora peruviana]|uniref:Uncharacterized protein n=1 Tax=Apodospora peruviana TaxID=516989 RepID=A0AAE0MGJ6_9PEZI|nr:hypothetical protein B0H66DRAFT_96720 [Apodospora peruviana]
MRLQTLTLAITTASAAVVIIPGGDPKPYSGGNLAATSEMSFFRKSAPNEFFNNTAKLIMTSHSVTGTNFSSSSGSEGLHPSGDSFIRGAIQAWGEHLHLVIRPDEVWFTILVQMNFYMLSHAEEIRKLFVDHEGQKEIYIEDLTWYDILMRFKDEIQKRVKTDWLLEWIVPNFSTTTESDVMTANILMMGLTKAYFKFSGKVVCGLPSVTLLGSQQDWEKLLAKLERLPAFGSEAEQYRARLRPILSRFVTSFRDPDSPATKDFWNQIVSAKTPEHPVCGMPPLYVSGWITGFYFWNDNGGPFARGQGQNLLTLDGISYPMLDLSDVPIGYARAPFLMHDFNGTDKFEAYVAAGMLGKQITAGPPVGYKEALQRSGGNLSLAEDENRHMHGTLKPLSGWMLYGPLSHNVSSKERLGWVIEEELGDVQADAMRFMKGGRCGLFDAPKVAGR